MPDNSNKEIISKVNAWLDVKKPVNKITQSENVELLRSNLDFSAVRIEQSAGNEKIIVIPVKEGLKQKKNLDEKAIPNLVLIIDNMGNIRKGNLVLFYPKEGFAYNKVPDNTFYAILNTANPEAGGKFKYLSVTRKSLHELEYENGRLKSFGYFKDSSLNNNNARTNTCLNWYWVTTYYKSDGEVIDETWSYIGTTCLGEDCQDPYNAMLCPMSNEYVGTGGNEGYEFAVSKTVPWTVSSNPVNPNIGEIKSIETIKGKRSSSEPAGGYFTSITHITSACNFCSSANPSDVWIEQSVSVNLYPSLGLAASQVGGVFNITEPDTILMVQHLGDFRNCFKISFMLVLSKILILFFSLGLMSCNAVIQKTNIGAVRLNSVFYQETGQPIFNDTKKVWYRDSVSIQQINRTNFVRDTAGATSVNYSVLLFRFIDLRNKVFYDYKNFSDTALPFNHDFLPDSMMRDGWAYYSDKVRVIQDPLFLLSDTTINEVSYKRARFNFFFDDTARGYKIGYFRCDGKGTMFSLEKKYSKAINCTMTKFVDFHFGRAVPYASVEVEFITDSLSEFEVSVFNAWEKNARNNPVKK